MAQPFVHGPVHLYVGIGAGGGAFAPAYLGTGERAPRYSLRRGWEKVMNDVAGVVLPFDYSYQGIEAFITVKLTRWNEGVLSTIQDTVGNGQGAAHPGLMNPGDIGSLVNTEGLGMPLWMHYSYGAGGLFAKAAYATMPPGYHFYSTFLEGPDDREGGTDPASTLLTFHAIRTYLPSAGAFLLFDSNMTGISLPN